MRGAWIAVSFVGAHAALSIICIALVLLFNGQWDALLAVPHLAGNIALLALSLGAGGALTGDLAASFDLPAAGGLNAALDGSISIFGGLFSWWQTLLLIAITIVAAMVAALSWRLRAGRVRSAGGCFGGDCPDCHDTILWP